MPKVKLKTPPWCKFCGQDIERPQPPEERKLGEFALGHCQCGTVYASDPTGHNVGAAMVECLVHACGDNWDLAWELLPEDDYLTGRLENYDEVTHQVVETRNLDGRLVRGVIYFIRLHEDIAELSRRIENAEERPAGVAVSCADLRRRVPVALEPERDPKRTRKRAAKVEVRTLVENQDIDALVDLCFDDRKTLRFMQRLLYDPDEGRRWATAHLIGKVFGRFSTRQPGVISDVLHRMFESCADSAAANWGAVETIGEIIAMRPDIYGSFVRHLLPFAADSSMRLQVLWALGTIAGQRPDLIRNTPFYELIDLLDSPDPGVRGHTLRLMGRIRAKELAGRIGKLQDDPALVVIYEKGLPVETSIGQLAREAMALITDQE